MWAKVLQQENNISIIQKSRQKMNNKVKLFKMTKMEQLLFLKHSKVVSCGSFVVKAFLSEFL